MRAYLANLGCKLNQAELEHLARQLQADGHLVTSRIESADVQVINTCTVTHVAARTSRKIARQGVRRRPGLKTILTGCYVSGAPEEAATLAGVDLVVPNIEKNRLLERLYDRFPEWRPVREAAVPVPYVPLEFGNSRALVKVEDGCNMACTFCIIPTTRGRQLSRPLPEVVADVGRLVGEGRSEVVITGVQISSYRWRESRLYDLISALLDRTTVGRVRLTSIAPWDFDRRLLDLVRGGRVCRHFHLSLQSGCQRTLRRMRRPYSPGQFRDLADGLRQEIPGLAITTDVIVGFPGETERDHRESLSFVESLGFARLHVFPYSPRPGTAAADLPEAVHPTLQRERMREMLEVAESSRRRFELGQIGDTVPVLWETRHGGAWVGTSDNYLRVETVTDIDLASRITATRVQAAMKAGVKGRIEGKGLRPAPPVSVRHHDRGTAASV